MVIYTKKGDQGYASILNGERIPKDDEIIKITGKIDSTQSSIDTANIKIKDEETKKILQNINEKLWQLAAEISNKGLSEIIKKPITEQDIQELEQNIDKHHPENKYFIRFTKETSTTLNEVRVRVRELESQLTKMLREKQLRPEAYQYINRLSDLIYSLACKEEQNN